MRPISVLVGGLVLVACGGGAAARHEAPTVIAPAAVAAPATATPSAPASAPEAVRGVEWTTRTERFAVAGCDAAFAVPVVASQPALAASVSRWVRDQIDARRESLQGAECGHDASLPVAIHRVRGFVTVAFSAPESLLSGYVHPFRATFAHRTGRLLENAVPAAKRDRFLAQVEPRYGATMDASLRERRAESGDSDCEPVRGQYGASYLTTFDVTESGFSFHPCESLPLWAKACCPASEPTFTGEELASFLEPEILAAWRDE